MNPNKNYHTSKEFDSQGIDPFIEHVKRYLLSEDTIPFSITTDYMGNEILFTFSDSLLKKINRDPGRIKKPYGVAVKFGLQGYSRGGRNGIFYQRDNDLALLRRTNSLIVSAQDEIMGHLDVTKNGLDELRRVKIVWHRPDGERVVGVQNTANNKIAFLDFANYNH